MNQLLLTNNGIRPTGLSQKYTAGSTSYQRQPMLSQPWRGSRISRETNNYYILFMRDCLITSKRYNSLTISADDQLLPFVGRTKKIPVQYTGK